MRKITNFIKENLYQVMALISLAYTIIVFGGFLFAGNNQLNLENMLILGIAFVSFFFSTTFGSVYFLSCRGTTKSTEYDGSVLPKAFILFSALFVVSGVVWGLYKNNESISILVLVSYGAFALYWTMFAIFNKIRNTKLQVI